MKPRSHNKAKREYKHGTAQRTAFEAITPEQFNKGGFELDHTTKMLEGSEERTVVDHHMKRPRPDIKCLQKLKLEDYQIDAANRYDSGLEALVSGQSHELREWVQTSTVNTQDERVGRDSDCVLVNNFFKNGATFEHKMLGGILNTVFIGRRGDSIRCIVGDSGTRRADYADNIRYLLTVMARVYGITS